MSNIIGNNIKMLRNSIGLRQSTIASFLNVNQSLISNVEKGEKNLSADLLEKLACLFGVSINDIESNTVEASPLSAAFMESDLSIDELEMISDINRIALNSKNMAEILKR